MIWVFLSLAILDILTTYIGRSRGCLEANPVLAKFGKNLAMLIQIALYATVFYTFYRLPMAGRFIIIALPAYAVTRNLKALLTKN